MKLRIKGNSLRIRLTKQEVGRIAESGYLEEQTLFAENKFIYALQRVDHGNELSATIETNKITMFIPNKLIKDWPVNKIVGFDANMRVSESDTLYLLLEKDFVCSDETMEGENDNYENPNKAC